MADLELVTAELLRGWALPSPGSDKHARGEILVVGGSRETPGAVALAGESALRVGAGKLRIATAQSVAVPMAVALPEALVRGLQETAGGDIDPSLGEEIAEMADGAAVALLGPGILDKDNATALLERVVPQLECAAVLDALGSAYLTEHRDGVRHLEGRCVLTVNPSELSKTLEIEEDEVEADPTARSRELAEQTQAVVVCGGSDKVVAAPDGRAFQITRGGPGLGVSGSGDVQAGLVAGLLARGADPLQAAVWGAFLHASAGDQLSQQVAEVGYLARELPGVVPRLMASLQV